MNVNKSFSVVVVMVLVLSTFSFSLAREGADVKDSIVKLYTAYNRYNYHEPWVMKGMKNNHGSGSIIAGKRILTNAHVVSDRMFIQARRGGQAKKYTAEVQMISHEADLAILSVEDDSFFLEATPLEIGDLPAIQDAVSVYGFPEGGDKLSLTEGVVSRIEHTNYAHSGAYLLSGQVDASINSGNSGGPVLKDGEIVGVAFQSLRHEKYDNIGYIVPAPVVKHFLEDIEDSTFEGTPDLGVAMQEMENPDLRKNAQMAEGQTGVLISQIYPDSPGEGALKKGDVILSIDGISIENDGTIEFRKGERTFFAYLLQQKQINDFIQLLVLRNGHKKHLTIQLTQSTDFERLVPHRQYDIPPRYFIIGGLVFEPLTLNYLMEFGTNWHAIAPLELINLYVNGEPQNNRREVLVLVKVLADQLNVGYHDLKNIVISTVNGQSVSNFKDLVQAFENHTGEYHVIEDIYGFKIILNTQKTKEASREILNKYKIPVDRSVDLQ